MSDKTQNEESGFDLGKLFGSFDLGGLGDMFGGLFNSEEKEPSEPKPTLSDKLELYKPKIENVLYKVSGTSFLFSLLFFGVYFLINSVSNIQNLMDPFNGLGIFLMFLFNYSLLFMFITSSIVSVVSGTSKFLVTTYYSTIINKYKDKINLLDMFL